MTLIRISRLYIILGKNFNAWISPILTGILFFLLRLFVGFGRYLDLFLFRGLDKPLNKHELENIAKEVGLNTFEISKSGQVFVLNGVK